MSIITPSSLGGQYLVNLQSTKHKKGNPNSKHTCPLVFIIIKLKTKKNLT